MKFAFVFVFSGFPFGGPPERQPADDWFARDKVLHFTVSALIQGSVHASLRSAGLDYREASVGAGVATLSAGLGKELWDRSRGGAFSWKDLAADGVGGGAGAVLVRQVDR